jgi:hypothetical protein
MMIKVSRELSREVRKQRSKAEFADIAVPVADGRANSNIKQGEQQMLFKLMLHHEHTVC